MRTVPTINTVRLTLRTMRLQDFERFAEIWGDAGRSGAGVSQDAAACWNAFLCNAGQWQMTGFGHWAVEIHGTRQMMGFVGFSLRKEGFGADFDAFPEAGWRLHPDIRGDGIGAEAALAAHGWFDRVVTGPLVCRLAVGDSDGQQIAEAMGYAPLRNHVTAGHDIQLMQRKTPPGGPRNLMADLETCDSLAMNRTVLAGRS